MKSGKQHDDTDKSNDRIDVAERTQKCFPAERFLLFGAQREDDGSERIGVNGEHDIMYDHKVQNVLAEQRQRDREAHKTAVERTEREGIGADILRVDAENIFTKEITESRRDQKE